MQNDAKVYVKVGSDLVLASTRRGRVGGYGICYKSKTVFWNRANIARECARNITQFVRNFELTLPPIIEWDCII